MSTLNWADELVVHKVNSDEFTLNTLPQNESMAITGIIATDPNSAARSFISSLQRARYNNPILPVRLTKTRTNVLPRHAHVTQAIISPHD